MSASNEVLEEGLSLPVGSALTKSYALSKPAYANGLLSLNLTVLHDSSMIRKPGAWPAILVAALLFAQL